MKKQLVHLGYEVPETNYALKLAAKEEREERVAAENLKSTNAQTEQPRHFVANEKAPINPSGQSTENHAVQKAFYEATIPAMDRQGEYDSREHPAKRQKLAHNNEEDSRQEKNGTLERNEIGSSRGAMPPPPLPSHAPFQLDLIIEEGQLSTDTVKRMSDDSAPTVEAYSDAGHPRVEPVPRKLDRHENLLARNVQTPRQHISEHIPIKTGKYTPSQYSYTLE